jgi:hypothetical protein
MPYPPAVTLTDEERTALETFVGSPRVLVQ